MVVIGIICGADSWDAIEEFGKAKKDFLSTFLTLQNEHEQSELAKQFHRMILLTESLALNPQKFKLAFISWVNSLKNKEISGEVIAIDGKTVKASKDSFHGAKAIHLVNAWACSNELVLGQLKVDGKSNELRSNHENQNLNINLSKLLQLLRQFALLMSRLIGFIGY